MPPDSVDYSLFFDLIAPYRNGTTCSRQGVRVTFLRAVYSRWTEDLTVCKWNHSVYRMFPIGVFYQKD
ncbi:hypothetical protein F2P79_002337 [Pimephales promelas]|nr:hypothetical protein F2P79_002337 [Pimephales promelas]